MKKLIMVILLLSIITGCKENKKNSTPASSVHLFLSIDRTTQTLIHDIFSPPQASRIYAYPNILAYEIAIQGNRDYTSLAQQIKGFESIEKADTNTVDLQMAATLAHIKISKKLVFTEDLLTQLEDSLTTIYRKNPKFEATQSYVDKAVNQFSKWIEKDNYAQTRTMTKYTVDFKDEGKWQPTPPAYMDGVEPNWDKMRTLVLDSASQFKPIPPPVFSLDKNSQFFKEMMEVYTVSKDITEKGDDSEQMAIAQFWDCNPYVSVTRGHFMFATKKITPGGHWMGIAMIAAKKNKSDFCHTLYAVTMTSMALYDGFISCWDEKYRSNLVRPETIINNHIDETWKPILQTPPFPEYTSGHSVVSGAASTVLTKVFGGNFSFDDTSEIPFGLPTRKYNSFKQAADEAAISRLYGGIHYRAAIEQGLKQGNNVGDWIIGNIKMYQK